MIFCSSHNGQLVNEKKPTGSAAIPEDVAWAKEINEMINEKVEVQDVDDDNKELTILDVGATTDHDSAVLISSDGEQDGRGRQDSLVHSAAHSETPLVKTFVASHMGLMGTAIIK